jgi:hypothetical protein
MLLKRGVPALRRHPLAGSRGRSPPHRTQTKSIQPCEAQYPHWLHGRRLCSAQGGRHPCSPLQQQSRRRHGQHVRRRPRWTRSAFPAASRTQQPVPSPSFAAPRLIGFAPLRHGFLQHRAGSRAWRRKGSRTSARPSAARPRPHREALRRSGRRTARSPSCFGEAQERTRHAMPACCSPFLLFTHARRRRGPVPTHSSTSPIDTTHLKHPDRGKPARSRRRYPTKGERDDCTTRSACEGVWA